MDNMLQAWLKQYQADAALDEADDAVAAEDIEGVENHSRLARAVNQYDTNLAIGQVRIMTSDVTKRPDHVPYVAILGRWAETSWLVVPFSRFTVPAVRGEMLTGIDDAFQTVLQCWNGKIVPSSVLQKSWLAGQLPEPVRIDAYDLFRHLATNTPFMATFKSTVGPALTDPLDIRNNYMAEERDQLRPFDVLIAQACGYCPYD